MGWWRKIKAWHVALSVVALCGIGGWFTTWLLTHNANAQVEAQKLRLHRLGVPITTAELVRNIPDDQNAAPLYREAFEFVHTMHIKEPTMTLATAAHEVDYDAMTKYVKDMGPTMEIVEKASLRPDCYFSRPWEKGWLVLYPEYADLKRFTKVTSYAARLATRNHDFRAALKWNAMGFRIARHADEPCLIGMLVRIACEAIVLSELDKEVVEFGDNAEFRTAAMQMLKNLAPLPSLDRAMHIEIPTQMMVYNQIGKPEIWKQMMSTDGVQVGSARYLSRFEFVRKGALAKSLTLYADAIEAIHPDPSNWKVASEAFVKMDEKLIKDGSVTGTLVQLISPAFSQIGQAVGRLEAHRKITEVALLVYAMKSKEGKFPTILPKSMPKDPFSDENLVYDRSGDRFILYSVGPNGKDDGGKPISGPMSARTPLSGSHPTSDDVEFSVMRP